MLSTCETTVEEEVQTQRILRLAQPPADLLFKSKMLAEDREVTEELLGDVDLSCEDVVKA